MLRRGGWGEVVVVVVVVGGGERPATNDCKGANTPALLGPLHKRHTYTKRKKQQKTTKLAAPHRVVFDHGVALVLHVLLHRLHAVKHPAAEQAHVPDVHLHPQSTRMPAFPGDLHTDAQLHRAAMQHRRPSRVRGLKRRQQQAPSVHVSPLPPLTNLLHKVHDQAGQVLQVLNVRNEKAILTRHVAHVATRGRGSGKARRRTLRSRTRHTHVWCARGGGGDEGEGWVRLGDRGTDTAGGGSRPDNGVGHTLPRKREGWHARPPPTTLPQPLPPLHIREHLVAEQAMAASKLHLFAAAAGLVVVVAVGGIGAGALWGLLPVHQQLGAALAHAALLHRAGGQRHCAVHHLRLIQNGALGCITAGVGVIVVCKPPAQQRTTGVGGEG